MSNGNAINAFALRTERGGTLQTIPFEPGNEKARERARQEANRQRDAWLTRTDRFIGVKLYVEPVSV